jgi:hypothetical protein
MASLCSRGVRRWFDFLPFGTRFRAAAGDLVAVRARWAILAKAEKCI